MKIEEYVRPRTVTEAVRLLKDADAQALAGGTELLSRRRVQPRVVVDLQDLPLNYIREDSDAIHIGALTTLETLCSSALALRAADGILAHCAQLAATSTERYSATVGGTLAAPRWSELTVALIVVDAWARLAWSGGMEVVPVDVLVCDRQAWLDLGTLITDVIVPAQPNGARFSYQRVSRTPRDHAIVAAAARLARDASGCVCSSRLALGGVQPEVVRLESAERDTDGRVLNDSEVLQVAQTAQSDLAPEGDWLASAEYRREMSGVLLRRALIEARNRMV